MILLKGPDGKAVSAKLTTDHSASSYGVPVVVLKSGDKSGEAFGPADLALNGYRIMTATGPEQDKLRAFGYRLD